VPGYPIRTPSDQRSVDSSPRTIAASHVLHRLLMPRHPPCALDNLTNTHIKKSRHKCAQKQKMLASTVQFSTTTRTGTAPRTTRSRPRPSQRQQPQPEDQEVVLSGPNSVPTQHHAGLVWCFHFSRATPSHTRRPVRRPAHEQVPGPSTTRRGLRRTLACDQPPPVVSGEAP
jgi:hypothetical protein